MSLYRILSEAIDVFIVHPTKMKEELGKHSLDATKTTKVITVAGVS